MSRVGKTIIIIPAGIKLEQIQNQVKITGPKGELTLKLPVGFNVQLQGNQAEIKQQTGQDKGNLHGLTRALIQNAVTGVSIGWEKKLQLVGVGYKATTDGKELTINVGFTHPVKFAASLDISFTVKENTQITVLGIDKKQVGEVAAQIRAVKPPEPYKGKGIRYLGEIVRKKAGKAVKAVGSA